MPAPPVFSPPVFPQHKTHPVASSAGIHRCKSAQIRTDVHKHILEMVLFMPPVGCGGHSCAAASPGALLEAGLVSQSPALGSWEPSVPAPAPGSAPGCPHKPLSLRFINCHQITCVATAGAAASPSPRLLPAVPGSQIQPRRDGRGGGSLGEGGDLRKRRRV